jgi:DNA repair ATPase RecN
MGRIMARRGVWPRRGPGTFRDMNPFDALLIGPAAIKRALDDLHDIARLARRYERQEEEILERVAALEVRLERVVAAVEAIPVEIAALMVEIAPVREIAPLRAAVTAMGEELVRPAGALAALEHLGPMRRALEPLERSMVAVRESVDDLEPMLADLDRKMQTVEPKLDELKDAVEPIGELAERIPGAGRRHRKHAAEAGS